jgi:hypothetical protein
VPALFLIVVALLRKKILKKLSAILKEITWFLLLREWVVEQELEQLQLLRD